MESPMDDKNIYSPPNADIGSQLENRTTAIDSNLASRWARLGAYSIDTIILIAVYSVVFYDSEYWEKAMQQNTSVQEQILSVMFGFAVYLLFNGYFLHKRGQTIGKWTLGIKIVAVENNKILPLWKVFFVRYVPQIFVALIPIGGLFLILVNDSFIFRKDKRCVHDHISGSKVVKEYAH
jgi:uncharacterized RDD family membrane protein YckC